MQLLCDISQDIAIQKRRSGFTNLIIKMLMVFNTLYFSRKEYYNSFHTNI